jgi:HipA-like kinase
VTASIASGAGLGESIIDMVLECSSPWSQVMNGHSQMDAPVFLLRPSSIRLQRNDPPRPDGPERAVSSAVPQLPVLRTVRVTRYVTPLREGGSLPAIVEADDDGLYVLKFRGAGQGAKALIAELVSGEIARAIGLPIPELVFADLDPDLARTEPDPEIHALIRESAGLNLALDYLPGSVNFDPVVEAPAADLASRIVWFDAYVTNVDRTARNTNILMWHRRLWLIDHGATLYFHHAADWEAAAARARDPFPMIKHHVLLGKAGMLEAVDRSMADALPAAVIHDIVCRIPDLWLAEDRSALGPEQIRAAYASYLIDRLTPPRRFVEEAARAR